MAKLKMIELFASIRALITLFQWLDESEDWHNG